MSDVGWFDRLAFKIQTEHRARTRGVLLVLALGALGLAVLTIRRVPTPFSDVQLYASIALSRTLYGVGVPTISWNSPVAVDHIPFYGPVFFDLAAAALRVFGMTLVSFRLVSIAGTLLFILAGGLLARSLSSARDGWLWSVALLALTPEVNTGMAAGAMHMLAVAWEMLALAVFVRGLEAEGRGLWHGVAAGAFLTLAALTTPRSYPLIFAFLCAGATLPCMASRYRPAARRQCAVTTLCLFAAMMIWATASHGSPARWFRYMAYMFTHEDTDIAILPTAVRLWSFSWTNALTPAVGVVAALLIARSFRREDDEAMHGRIGRAAFVLVTTWITCVTTIMGTNLTFTVGEYFALPLMAAVLAMPRAQMKIRLGTVAIAIACLAACDAGLLALRYARVAATWAARDPTPLNEFVSAHVPPRSEVVGPEEPYFFPVERSGSRYRTVSARSWADWARWVPRIEPEAMAITRGIRVDPPAARFFIWPASDDLPDRYGCVARHVVAIYHRAPDHLRWLGPFGHPQDTGYPESVLYRLLPGCPEGYDPTAPSRP